ncbi:C40 family peptidase [Paenibacillus ehimensis]|uniref:C40 family peptidase n=1 Tax=Paenibacillus ehimensis TaxID=79264 RepID=UPI000FD89F12|nr:NlpC/P60 family protein [Paenibacillus ehimensis]
MPKATTGAQVLEREPTKEEMIAEWKRSMSEGVDPFIVIPNGWDTPEDARRKAGNEMIWEAKKIRAQADAEKNAIEKQRLIDKADVLATTGRKMGGVISREINQELARNIVANERILDARMAWLDAQKKGDEAGKKQAEQDAGEARKLGGTIPNCDTEEMKRMVGNQMILSAKILWAEAHKEHNQANKETAEKLAAEGRAMGGTITLQDDLADAQRMVGNEMIWGAKQIWADPKQANGDANQAVASAAYAREHMGGTITIDHSIEEAERVVADNRSHTPSKYGNSKGRAWNGVFNKAEWENHAQFFYDTDQKAGGDKWANDNLFLAELILYGSPKEAEWAKNNINKVTKNSEESANDATDLVTIAQNVIFGNEGDYGTVVDNDNGALSIGKIQWHADRAFDLLNKIKNLDTSQGHMEIQKILEGTSLFSELSQDRSTWGARIITDKREHDALKKLLTTPWGKQVQDQQAREDVQGYLDSGKNQQGITDKQALIYFSDLYNQSPKRAVEVVRSISGAVTLDSIHAAALENNVMGQYENRRNATYNNIKNYKFETTDSKSKTTEITETKPKDTDIKPKETAESIQKATNGSSSSDAKRKAIVNQATKWIGQIEYLLENGTSTTINFNTSPKPSVMDCSAFTSSVFLTELNINIGRSTGVQIERGKVVSDYQLGDLVFTGNGGHVGIYAGKDAAGDDIMVHEGPKTSNSEGNVKITKLKYMGTIAGVRRIIQDDGSIVN